MELCTCPLGITTTPAFHKYSISSYFAWHIVRYSSSAIPSTRPPMGFEEFWGKEILTIGEQPILLGRVIAVVIGLLLVYGLSYMLRRKWLQRFFEHEVASEKGRRRIRRLTTVCLVLISLLILVLGIPIDFAFSDDDQSVLKSLHFSTIIEALLIYYLARLVDEGLSDLLTRRYQQRREQQILEGGLYQITAGGTKVRVSHIVQPIVYLISLTFIIQQLGLDFEMVFRNTCTSYQPDACGRSHGLTGSDVERILAFHEIGVVDPIEYQQTWDEVVTQALRLEQEFRASQLGSLPGHIETGE